MRLPDVIQYLFPAAVLGVDVVIVDHGDGQGFRIGAWRLAAPQPTAEQLAEAWAAVEAKKVEADAFWNARLAMASKYTQLPVEVRARYRDVYNDINEALQRGDVELAYYSLVNMNVYPGDEQLHAEFLALFPSQS